MVSLCKEIIGGSRTALQQILVKIFFNLYDMNIWFLGNSLNLFVR